MAQPRVVELPGSVYRVARADDPLRASWIRPEDAVHRKAGNRYDVAGGGVLYAATQLMACFAETLAFLSDELAPQLVALGYDENLDLSLLRNADRRLSRAISLWAYAAEDSEGQFRYGGIRYTSRLGEEWENWAIFDGVDYFETSRRPIHEKDPDLLAVARILGLTIH